MWFFERVSEWGGLMSPVDDGQEFIYRRFIAPSAEIVRFSKALNRSVIGSMNDHIVAAKILLTEHGMSPHDVSFQLNETPLSAIDYANPREALKSLEYVTPSA